MEIRPRRFVSLKICQGSNSPKPDTEATILQYIKDNPEPGSENIIYLHDVFVIHGPNGYHSCLVTEIVIPLGTLGADGSRLESLYSPRSVINQVVRGFAYLHTQGLAHGGKQPLTLNTIQTRYLGTEIDLITDPTPANIGIAIPQINRFTEEDLLHGLAADMELYPVIPVDPLFPMDTVPRYLIGRVSLLDFLLARDAFTVQNSTEIRIFDFSRGKV